MSVADNIKYYKENKIPSNVTLIAVSKTKPIEDIQDAYDGGQRVFGENRAQELASKYEVLPKDIVWHMIGHLQTNKVKYIAPFVSLIHGVDSLKLLSTINKEAEKNNRVINCLLQFYIATEETKFGLDLDEARTLLNSDLFKEMNNVNIVGVMGMASFTEDEELIRKEFNELNNNFKELKTGFFVDSEDFKEISMGMSNDFNIAIEEGATMVRIGSLLFGSRN